MAASEHKRVSDPKEQGPERASGPWRKGLKRLVIASAVMVALLALLAAAIPGYFLLTHSAPGKAAGGFLSTVISDPPGLVVEIDRVRVDGIGRITLEDITIADADGVWAEADRVHIGWKPGQLLSRMVHVERVDIPDLTLHRLPVASEQDMEDPFAVQLAWPDPGIDIRVDTITAALALPHADAPYDMAGGLDLSGDELRADFKLTGEDSVTLLVDGDAARNRLTLDADVMVSGGGPLAQLFGFSDQGARLRLTGDGELSDWQADIDLALPAGETLVATIARNRDSSAGDHMVVYGLTGDLAFPETGIMAALLPEDLVSGLAGTYRLNGMAGFAVTPASGRAGRVVLSRAGLDLVGNTLSLNARMDLATTPDAAHVDLRLGDPAALAPVLGDVLFDEARLDGTLAVVPAMAFEGRFRLDGVRTGGVAVTTVDGQLALETAGLIPDGNGDTGLVVKAEGVGRDVLLAGEADALALKQLDWKLAASWPDGSPRIDVHQIDLDGDGLMARAHGAVNVDSGAIEADGDITLGDLSIFWDGLEAGRYSGAFHFESETDALGLDLDGVIDGLEATDPRIAELLNEGRLRLEFATQASDGADSTSRFGGSFVAPAFTLTTDGSLLADDGIDATLALDISDADGFSRAAGVRVTAESSINARVQGAISSPDLSLEGRLPGLGDGPAAFEAVTLDATIKDILGAPSGQIRFEGISLTGPVRADITLQSPDADHVALTAIRIDTPFALFDGALTYDRPNDMVDGHLRGESGALESVRDGLDFEGDGSFTFELVLAPEGDRQTARLDMSGQAISTVLADRQSLTVENLDVSGSVVLPGGVQTAATPETLSFDSHIGDLHAGALTLQEVRFSASGKDEFFPYEFAARGDFFGVIDVSGTGEFRLVDGGFDLGLAALDGTLADRALSLGDPVTYIKRADSTRLTPLVLEYGDGRIDAVHETRPGRWMVEINIEETDAAFVPLFVPIRPITGALDAHLLVDVQDGVATGYAALAARNIMPRARESENYPVEAALSMELDSLGPDGENVRVRGRVVGPTLTSDLDGSLPVQVDPDGGGLGLGEGREIAATLTWDGVVAPLMALLPPMDHAFSGNIKGAVDIAGTVDDPAFKGRLALADGDYENFVFGSRLVNLTGELVFDQERIRLVELTGSDLNGGRLRGEGAFSLDAGQNYPGSLTLTLDDIRPVHLDAVRATAAGELVYERTPELFILKGDIEARRMELSLAQKLPTEITALEVIEINGVVDGAEEEDQPAASPAGEESRPFLEALDIRVNAPARIFVRGRGLDSEWRGDMRVRGTPDTPRVTGGLELVRGTFAFAGRQLELLEGRFQFTGGERIDPHVDLTGLYDTMSLEARIRILGPLSAPEILLSSTPALPRDEILARILFGTSVNELSAIEAVQLASAISSLSGGGGLDVFSGARGVLGLDRLTVDDGDSTTEGRLLTGGKYLTNNIYIELQTSTATGESNATVRFDVTRDLQIESDVGSDQSSRIGLRWKKDY